MSIAEPTMRQRGHGRPDLIAGTETADKAAAHARGAKRTKVELATALANQPMADLAEYTAKTYLADLAARRTRPSSAVTGLIDTCHRIVRLERGEATQISQHVDLAAELRELSPHIAAMAALRARGGELDPSVIQVESVAGELRAAATPDEHVPGP